MDSDIAIRIDHVSKKYCRSLQRTMLYGLGDITRNMFGIRSPSERLRKAEFWAIKDVSFDLKRGRTLGLIGPNGSGKTTLLKMINGIFWPDKGTISIRGRIGALIAVGAGFHPMLTGRENIYVNGAILGMSRDLVRKNFDAIVDFADIGDFLDTPVKHYSSGMFVRLGFAIAVFAEPEIMLVDEVLAVGDTGFQNKCFNRMGELRKQGTTFILVSHNMHTVAGFVDEVAVLHHGVFEAYAEPFDGIKRYTSLFSGGDGFDIEKVCSGGSHVQFRDVELSTRELNPGDSFVLSGTYDATEDYDDVEVDIAIYSGRDTEFFFQATNKAFSQPLHLKKGTHPMQIAIHDLRINDHIARITIAIWSKYRTEQLFWWRIPISCNTVHHSSGRSFVPVTYDFGGT